MTAISVVLWSDDPTRSATLRNALLAVSGLSVVPIACVTADAELATDTAVLYPGALHLLLDTETPRLRLHLMQAGCEFTVLWGTPDAQIAGATAAIQFARNGREASSKSELKAPKWQWHCPHCSDPLGEAHALHMARGLRQLIKNTGC